MTLHSYRDNLEVLMDDFSVFGNDFDSCLAHLTKILKLCVRRQLVVSWEKSHFMVWEGVVLGRIISGKGLQVDKAKIEVIQNLPLPATIRDLRSFLGMSASTKDSYKTLRKSPTTHHRSLQRQKLHHRWIRKTRIRDAETSTDQGTDNMHL